MKYSFLFMLCCAVGVMGQERSMTLGDCIQTGIANNLSLSNARIEVAKGRTGVSQSRSRLLPVVQGVFQFTDYLKSPVNVTTGTLLGNDFPEEPTWQTIKSMPYNANAGIQLTMPLYNQTLLAAVEVARTVEKIQALSYEKAVEELTMQIGKVYYWAQTAQAQMRLSEENIRRMETLCEITEALYQQGVVMEVDLNRARINLQGLQAQQDQFQTLYAQQLHMLKWLLNIDADTPLEVVRMADRVDHVMPPTGVSQGLPELRLAERQKELADRQIRTVRAGYLPSLSLTGYAGAIGYQTHFDHFFHTHAASDNWFGNCYLALSIRIPLFEANAKRLQIRQYRFATQQAANRIEWTQKQLDERYHHALLQWTHNLEVFQTQSESYRQAEAVYNVTEEQYKEGVSSMTALLQDEMQLRAAQAACVQAHCQCNLARLDLLRLAGQLEQLSR